MFPGAGRGWGGGAAPPHPAGSSAQPRAVTGHGEGPPAFLQSRLCPGRPLCSALPSGQGLVHGPRPVVCGRFSCGWAPLQCAPVRVAQLWVGRPQGARGPRHTLSWLLWPRSRSPPPPSTPRRASGMLRVLQLPLWPQGPSSRGPRGVPPELLSVFAALPVSPPTWLSRRVGSSLGPGRGARAFRSRGSARSRQRPRALPGWARAREPSPLPGLAKAPPALTLVPVFPVAPSSSGGWGLSHWMERLVFTPVLPGAFSAPWGCLVRQQHM